MKNKSSLLDEDFFPPNDNNVNLDSYRLFKEIPIICEDLLKEDVK